MVDFAIALIRAFALLPTIKILIDKVIAVYLSELEKARVDRIKNAVVDVIKSETKEERNEALNKWIHSIND